MWRTRSSRTARRGRANHAEDLDQEVVVLREQGQSYSAVARSLGIKRATDAQAAFLRVMRRLPDAERKALYKRESDRLDQLEARIREPGRRRTGKVGAPPRGLWERCGTPCCNN